MTTTQNLKSDTLAKATNLLAVYTLAAETNRNGRGSYYARLAEGQARRVDVLKAS